MTTPMNMIRDIAGNTTFAPLFSDTKFSMELDQDDEETLTIPASSNTAYPNYLAIFSTEVGSNFWVALNATAAYPSGSPAATNSEQNPTARYIKGDGNQVLHFITSDTTAKVGVILYAVP